MTEKKKIKDYLEQKRVDIIERLWVKQLGNLKFWGQEKITKNSGPFLWEMPYSTGYDAQGTKEEKKMELWDVPELPQNY